MKTFGEVIGRIEGQLAAAEIGEGQARLEARIAIDYFQPGIEVMQRMTRLWLAEADRLLPAWDASHA
jgi:hypothetical protein